MNSPANVLFPVEVLKAAYERLSVGIDSDEVLLVQRLRGQEAEYRFRPTSELFTIKLPGNTILKLWKLLQNGYDRTKLIPCAYLCDGFVHTFLLDASKYRVEN